MTGFSAPRTSLLDDELRTALLRLVEDHAGIRRVAYQAGLLEGVVARLLADSTYPTAAELLSALLRGERGDLLDRLTESLTIGETHFFRIAPQIAALQQVVLPDLIKRHATERRLSLWSAGCSTGEEPYTLAILLRDQLAQPDRWTTHILATDINRPALARAREAVYGPWSFRDTQDETRQRYFKQVAKHWHLSDVIRRMVRFAHLNMAADSWPQGQLPGSPFDLILCRNVTIYFGEMTTQRLYRRFAQALAPQGWLVLGPSDPTPGSEHGLEPVYVPGAVLWRRTHSETQIKVAEAYRGSIARPTPDSKLGAQWSDGIARSTPEPKLPVDQPASAPPASTTASADVNEVWALAREGERTAARIKAERLAGQRPLAAEAHLLLGMLLLDEGMSEQALVSLRRATFLDERNALAQFGLGRAYGQLGDAPRARAAFSHAQRLLTFGGDQLRLTGEAGVTVDELRRAIAAQLGEAEIKAV